MSPCPVECLVLGLPGAGKTLFAVSLAGVLGNASLRIYREEPDGRISSRPISAAQAGAEALGNGRGSHGLQWMTISVPMGLGRARQDVLLIDPAGLPPGVPEDQPGRAEAARTLSLLRRARFLVHLVDASSGESPSELDRAVVHFASAHLPGRFLLLASKMDLPQSRGGLRRIRKTWPETRVIPVSSFRRKSVVFAGRELRRCLQACAEGPAGRRRPPETGSG